MKLVQALLLALVLALFGSPALAQQGDAPADSQTDTGDSARSSNERGRSV